MTSDDQAEDLKKLLAVVIEPYAAEVKRLRNLLDENGVAHEKIAM